MRTDETWMTRMLTMAAILACMLLPVAGFAAEPLVNEQLLREAESGSLDRIKTLLAQG